MPQVQNVPQRVTWPEDVLDMKIVDNPLCLSWKAGTDQAGA